MGIGTRRDDNCSYSAEFGREPRVQNPTWRCSLPKRDQVCPAQHRPIVAPKLVSCENFAGFMVGQPWIQSEQLSEG